MLFLSSKISIFIEHILVPRLLIKNGTTNKYSYAKKINTTIYYRGYENIYQPTPKCYTTDNLK